MNSEGKKRLEIEDEIEENVEDNIYSNFTKEEIKQDKSDEVDPFDNYDLGKSTMDYDIEKFEKQDKIYKKETLKNNTSVSKVSLASRVMLFGFYITVVVIGIIAVFMIYAGKYEFYVKENEVLVGVGSSYQVELIPKDNRYFDYLKYDYSVGDESIATVDEFGTVTTKSVGKTSLKISLKPGITSKTIWIVSQDIDIDSFDIGVYKDDKYQKVSTLNLEVEQSTTIKAIINNRTDINITTKFISSDENVVTVDSFGNVTALGVGVATITGDLYGRECNIEVNVKAPTVTPKPIENNKTTTNPVNVVDKVNKIDLGIASQTIKHVGDVLKLFPKVEPNTVKNYVVNWSSSNEQVATVSKGLIICKGAGTTVITAEVNGTKATSTIIVKEK